MQYDELYCKKCGAEIEPKDFQIYLRDLFTIRYTKIKCHKCGFENKISAVGELEVEYYD
jgi:RNase P subunit RPR2